MSKKNKTKTVSARITEETFEKCKDQGVKISKIINDAITKEVNGHKMLLVEGERVEFKRVKIEDK
jgi:post-segregation antitoxin (ccd killing protein)